jgi:hypothetical protein
MTDNGDDAICELRSTSRYATSPSGLRHARDPPRRRAGGPPDRRDDVDAWVTAHGGQNGHEPLIVVHGGKSPKGPPGEVFYAIPPAASAP